MMKTSDKEIAQSKVDQVADELLHENGGDIDKVIGNQVAVRLGMAKGNQSVYDKLKVWRDKRRAEGIGFVARAPAGLGTAMEESLQPAFREACRIALGMTGQVIAEMQGTCELDKTALRHSLSKVEEDRRSLMLQLEESRSSILSLEEQLAAAQSELTVTRSELAGSRGREDELRSINARLMARVGDPADHSAATERCLAAANSQPKITEWNIDMSRYDYQDEADG